MTSARLLALPLLAALAGCGGAEEGAEAERRTAAGEVLGGTISDDMLPLDTVTSQSPPLREKGEGDSDSESAEGSGETAEVVDAAQPSPGPAPSEPTPAPPPEPTPETEE